MFSWSCVTLFEGYQLYILFVYKIRWLIKEGYKDTGHIHSKFKLREHRDDAAVALWKVVGVKSKVNLTLQCVHILTANKETGWLIVENRDISNSKEKCKLSCGMRSDSNTTSAESESSKSLFPDVSTFPSIRTLLSFYYIHSLYVPRLLIVCSFMYSQGF